MNRHRARASGGNSRWLVIALLLGSWFTSLAQARDILIEPTAPNDRQFVTLTITDSDCFLYQVFWSEDGHTVTIVLNLHPFIGAPHRAQCQQENPNAPDTSIVIGPLAAGDYIARTYTYVCQASFCSDVPIVYSTAEFTVSPASPSPGLSDGGINGFFYNPTVDGHYVSILDFDYGVLVLWPTFNENGEQALVYAVGELSEQGSAVIEAPAWVKAGGSVSLDGDFEPAFDEPWGTLSVEMWDCLDGTLRFHSEHADYGNGQLPLRRLAYVKQLGCTTPVDADPPGDP